MNKIFVANWKSNLNRNEAFAWVESTKESLESASAQVIICPNFLVTDALIWKLTDSKIKVGAQNVSPFPSGAFTGEVSAEILKAGRVNYCIVGHSERKKYFGETEATVAEKVKRLLEAEITPTLCLAETTQLDTYMNNYSYIKEGSGKIIFVYEPPSAISGGDDYKPESPEKASEIISQMKSKIGSPKAVLYGGSVNPDVIESFLQKEAIDGFLVGKASLDPQAFLSLISKS